MGTSSSITNLVFLATISSSAITLPYDYSENIIPKTNAEKMTLSTNIADWKDNAFNISTKLTNEESDTEKIKTIIEFSQRLIENSTDVEDKYIDIVNEKFWDLI